jgi:ubiquitin C-terminal hydrolase
VIGFNSGKYDLNVIKPVKISTEISFDNTNYELISVIHHHRNQNTRHYTSTVKYLKYYHVNDSVVEYQKLGDLEKSQTAYLVMYKQTSKLSITH